MTTAQKLSAAQSIRLNECKDRFQILEAHILEHRDWLDPKGSVRRYSNELMSSPLTQVAALQKKIADLTSPAADAIRQNVSSKANGMYPRQLLMDLLSESEGILQGYKAEAVAAERELFARFDVRHEPTAIARKFDSLIATVRSYRSELVSHRFNHVVPPTSHPWLEFLGVDMESV